MTTNALKIVSCRQAAGIMYQKAKNMNRGNRHWWSTNENTGKIIPVGRGTQYLMTLLMRGRKKNAPKPRIKRLSDKRYVASYLEKYWTKSSVEKFLRKEGRLAPEKPKGYWVRTLPR